MSISAKDIFDITLKATSCDEAAVFSPSRKRHVVDARCVFVHLSRLYGYRGRTPFFAEIAPRIARKPGEAAYLGRRAESLLSCPSAGHAADFQCYVARARRAIELSR
jgi:hypothetical protein